MISSRGKQRVSEPIIGDESQAGAGGKKKEFNIDKYRDKVGGMTKDEIYYFL